MLVTHNELHILPSFPPKCIAASLFNLEHIILGSCLETVDILFPKFYTDITIACFDNY